MMLIRTTRKLFSFLFLFIFTFQTVNVWPSSAQVYNLPILLENQACNPVILQGFTFDPSTPFNFNFILDQGDFPSDDVSKEGMKLVRYFLAALTIPEKDMWVNLSPKDPKRIIPQSFGQTEMGHDMLAQDYLLKQITSSLLNPEGEAGQKFWDEIYTKVYEKTGNADVPIDTLSRVWIVPDVAEVYVHEKNVFVANARLKVLMEEDYLKNTDKKQENSGKSDVSNIQVQVLKEIIVPVIEKEVNEGKTFAPLRQIYHSLILAAWFKKNYFKSVLGQGYVDRNHINGIQITEKNSAEAIYQKYIEEFKKGVYQFIREEYSPQDQKLVERKYVSGGVDIDLAMMKESQNGQSILQKLSHRNIERMAVELKSGRLNDSAMTSSEANEDTPLMSDEEWETATKYLQTIQGYVRQALWMWDRGINFQITRWEEFREKNFVTTPTGEYSTNGKSPDEVLKLLVKFKAIEELMDKTIESIKLIFPENVGRYHINPEYKLEFDKKDEIEHNLRDVLRKCQAVLSANIEVLNLTVTNRRLARTNSWVKQYNNITHQLTYYRGFLIDILHPEKINVMIDRSGYESQNRVATAYTNFLYRYAIELAKREKKNDEFDATGTGDEAMLSQEVGLAITPNDLNRIFNRLAKKYGGKIVWSQVLDILAENAPVELGFFRPKNKYFAIEKFWGEFIRQNQKWIDLGNETVKVQMRFNKGKLSDSAAHFLNVLLYGGIYAGKEYPGFTFPEQKLTQALVEFNEHVIIRSSGRDEDSFAQNLANVFTSVKVNKNSVPKAIEQIFDDAVKIIWRLKETAIPKKFPIELSASYGIGLEVDEFQDYDASGTVFTDQFQHVLIEAGIGDAIDPVQAKQAVAARYLVKKDGTFFDNGQPIKFSTSYSDFPYTFTLKGRTFSVKNKDPKSQVEMRQAVKDYPRINGNLAPMSEDEAVQLAAIAAYIEENAASALLQLANQEGIIDTEIPEDFSLPIAVDLEWGRKKEGPYIHQLRPQLSSTIGKNLVSRSNKIDPQKRIAEIPITIGATKPEGFTSKMVLFGNVDRETIKAFEEQFGKEYIRVQNEVASYVSMELYWDQITEAKVLIDPLSGSVQAHNVNYLQNQYKEANKEFIYASGPVMRKSLLSQVHWIPHPEIAGIWISQEDITYFSNGLEGEFYLGDQNALNTNHKPQSEIENKLMGDVELLFSELNSNNEIRIQNLWFHLSPLLGAILFKEEVSWNTIAEQMNLTIDELERNFENLVRDLKVISANPLFPAVWESAVANHLEGILNYHKQLVSEFESEQIELMGNEFAQKKGIFRVLYINDEPKIREQMKRNIDLKIAGRTDWSFETAGDLGEAVNKLKNREKSGKPYDFVIIDVFVPGSTEDMDSFKKCLRRVSEIGVHSDNHNHHVEELQPEIFKRVKTKHIWKGNDNPDIFTAMVELHPPQSSNDNNYWEFSTQKNDRNVLLFGDFGGLQDWINHRLDSSNAATRVTSKTMKLKLDEGTVSVIVLKAQESDSFKDALDVIRLDNSDVPIILVADDLTQEEMSHLEGLNVVSKIENSPFNQKVIISQLEAMNLMPAPKADGAMMNDQTMESPKLDINEVLPEDGVIINGRFLEVSPEKILYPDENLPIINSSDSVGEDGIPNVKTVDAGEGIETLKLLLMDAKEYQPIAQHKNSYERILCVGPSSKWEEIIGLLELFPNASIDVVDINLKELRLLRNYLLQRLSNKDMKRVFIFRAHANNLNEKLFPNNAYDLVFSNGVESSMIAGGFKNAKEFLTNIFNNMLRVVKEGGFIIKSPMGEWAEDPAAQDAEQQGKGVILTVSSFLLFQKNKEIVTAPGGIDMSNLSVNENIHEMTVFKGPLINFDFSKGLYPKFISMEPVKNLPQMIGIN